ncbi:MAG: ParB/RepB/Spo0J family partition protein [Pirellulales bacterium]
MTRSVQKIPLDKITWPDQVRDGHDEQDVASLAASFESLGNLYPVLVRPNGEAFVGIDGQTRCLAAARLGWKNILAIVDDAALGEGDALLRALTANLVRSDLKPRAKALGIKRYFGLTGCTASEAAARLGMTGGTITRLLALLDLPEAIASQVDSGAIGVSAGYQISRAAPEKQEELAAAVASGQVTREEVADEVARQKKGCKKPRRKRETTVVIAVDVGRIAVTARELSLEVCEQCLQAALDKVRQVIARGGDLNQLKRLCGEEAKAGAAA